MKWSILKDLEINNLNLLHLTEVNNEQLKETAENFLQVGMWHKRSKE